jgi:hypothetical protein
MEEFAEGGRLSPLKVKEFIPAGTLGIGQDENIWLRKARKDGKTYWNEFLETWNFKRFTPERYDLKKGIDFKARPKLDERYGFELFYGYNDDGGFILDIYDADTMLTVQKYETKDANSFRDICIKARQEMMPNDPILKYEFTEIVGKLTTAFERGELRKEFSEETPENPTPKFEIGDYVKVVNDGQQVMSAYNEMIEYQFDNFNESKSIGNDTEGYVVGVYFDSLYEEYRVVVKKYDSGGRILHEFIIAEQGLELVSKALKVGDVVYVKDTTYLYPTAPDKKTRLGFSDPSFISKASEVSYTTGEIFAVGQERDWMPIYGVKIRVLQEEILIGAQGLELVATPKDNLERTKIQVNNPEENKLIQEYAFSLGYYWLGVDRNIVQEFDKYPAYIEFTSGGQIFSPLNKKEFDKTYKKEVTLEELGLISPKPTESPTEFVCNVDSTKINSAYVGAFYSKNKERIEKLNSEFSCKILEALVYLSDYENCGGGVQLPIQEAIEEDDLLGAIRNLK